jgi:outer membrane protein assembly factor BamB
MIVGQTQDKPGFAVERDIDLTSVVAQGDKIISALPDWKGLIWFATIQGLVGTVDEASGTIQYFDTGEKIGNSFAVDETNAVYIVTDAALYRLAAEMDGSPTLIWRTTYENDGRSKPGQTEIGSGTTPTITPSGFVAITDNADPINIAVFRRTDGAFVCHAPVFEKGASNTDQSLIGAGNSFIAENNYGYSGPSATEQGGTTTPGLERVDVDAAGRCNKVWHSDEIAPSVVPKLSLANGLVYTYTKPGGERSDPWYLTALDFRTGKTVFKYKAGSGLGFNNNYAPVTIGPDGTAYVGTLGGLVALRDSTPPPRITFGADGRAPTARPRLKLRLRYSRGGTCSARAARATVVGVDRALVRRVQFRLGRRHLATDSTAPFSRRFRVGGGRFGAKVHARVLLVDGRRLKLHRPLQPCSRGVAG